MASQFPPWTNLLFVTCLRIGRKKSEVDQALPSMLQMSSLKRKSGDNINIIQQVAPHWQGFAVRLDFDRTGAKLQTIERRCHYDPEACCKEAMQLWLEGKGSRQPPTWKLLVDILYECDLKVLAGQVEQATK